MEARGYVQAALELYVQMPDTSARASPRDRLVARRFYDDGVTLEDLRRALLLASARRIRRDPELGPLGRIRSLAYFVSVVEEVRSEDWPEGYTSYLEVVVFPRGSTATQE